MIQGLYISLPSKYRRQTALGLHCLPNRIVDHPTGMPDEKYIVSEYLFWGPLQVIIGLPKMESFLICGFLPRDRTSRFSFFHLNNNEVIW